MSAFTAQYVATGTHEPTYRHELFEARSDQDARRTAESRLRRHEEILNIEAQRCPHDDGYCHHLCNDHEQCWRREQGMSLSEGERPS